MRVVSSEEVPVSCQPWLCDTALKLGELMWGPGLWTTKGHMCSAQLRPRPCFLSTWAHPPYLAQLDAIQRTPWKGWHLGLCPWAHMLSLSQCSEPAKRHLSLKDNLLNSAAVSLYLIQPQQNAGGYLWVRNMPVVYGHFSNHKFVGGNTKQLGVYLLPKVLLQPCTAAVWSGGSLQRL